MTQQHLPFGAISMMRQAAWIVANSSAGKDSQTMLRRIVNLCDTHNIPRHKIVVAHADLGDMEWPGTKALAREQANHYGLRFEVVRYQTKDGEQIDLLEYVRRRGKWPSSTERYCTSEFKRGPILALISRLVYEAGWPRGRLKRGRRPCVIVNCMGMRAQESPKRAKLTPWSLNERATNGKRTVFDFLPIHHWTVDEVWRDIHESGVPYHSAYDLGMPRLSCRFCIFSPRAALVLAGRHNPELLERYVAVEQAINHKFRKSLPLVDVLDAVRQGETPTCVEDWEM